MSHHINYLPGLNLSDHVCTFFELNVYITKPGKLKKHFFKSQVDYAAYIMMPME